MTAAKPTTEQDQSLREHLRSLLNGDGAHITLDDFVADFPAELCGKKLEGLPYTSWQVLEHMRIAQWDILEFSRDPKHVSPEFPKGYWPRPEEPGDAERWQRTVEGLRSDLKEMQKLVSDPATDLFAKIPHGSGQTVLREALVVADHNSYHLGALLVMAQILKHE